MAQARGVDAAAACAREAAVAAAAQASGMEAAAGKIMSAVGCCLDVGYMPESYNVNVTESQSSVRRPQSQYPTSHSHRPSLPRAPRRAAAALWHRPSCTYIAAIRLCWPRTGARPAWAQPHRTRRARGGHGHGMRRVREAVAEGCAANVRGRCDELAVSTRRYASRRTERRTCTSGVASRGQRGWSRGRRWLARWSHTAPHCPRSCFPGSRGGCRSPLRRSARGRAMTLSGPGMDP